MQNDFWFFNVLFDDCLTVKRLIVLLRKSNDFYFGFGYSMEYVHAFSFLFLSVKDMDVQRMIRWLKIFIQLDFEMGVAVFFEFTNVLFLVHRLKLAVIFSFRFSGLMFRTCVLLHRQCFPALYFAKFNYLWFF